MDTAAKLEEQWQREANPAYKERIARQRAVRRIVGDGDSTDVPLWVWRLGDSFLVGQPNEPYSRFQQTLRERFESAAVAVMNLVNGSIGYLPPTTAAGYSAAQSPFGVDALWPFIDAAVDAVEKIK
jgi:hypothetical protein